MHEDMTDDGRRDWTASHPLFYPQKPLFKTMSHECLKRAKHYNEQSAIIVVNDHHGYNQEDSLIINQASVNHGLF